MPSSAEGEDDPARSGVSGASDHGDSGRPLIVVVEVVAACSTGDSADPGANTRVRSNDALLAQAPVRSARGVRCRRVSGRGLLEQAGRQVVEDRVQVPAVAGVHRAEHGGVALPVVRDDVLAGRPQTQQ